MRKGTLDTGLRLTIRTADVSDVPRTNLAISELLPKRSAYRMLVEHVTDLGRKRCIQSGDGPSFKTARYRRVKENARSPFGSFEVWNRGGAHPTILAAENSRVQF